MSKEKEKENWEKAWNKIKSDIGSFFVLWLIMYALISYFFPKDSTDGESRSGIGLYVDNKTGCHYLGRGTGLTPRLDENENHICIGEENEQR